MCELVRLGLLVPGWPEVAGSAAVGWAAVAAGRQLAAVRAVTRALGGMRYPVYVRFAGLLLS